MTYPATFTIVAPEKVANWRPLVQWFMAIPHMIALYIVQIVASVLMFVGWIAIVVTGKLPGGIANYLCMANRYNVRVTAYMGFLHGEYPPFDFTMSAADPGGQPVRVDYEPALEGRNRLTVLLRFFWAIPAMIFAMVILFVAQIMWFVAFFAVLFTGKWPAGMHKFVVGAMGVNVRLGAYAGLLTDEYPPFETN
ncbi:MAG: hypothetical protein ACI9C1_000370 [Candidatus Aldehydirespiratoraceae bacterium]|jgi:hypothetical protein